MRRALATTWDAIYQVLPSPWISVLALGLLTSGLFILPLFLSSLRIHRAELAANADGDGDRTGEALVDVFRGVSWIVVRLVMLVLAWVLFWRILEDPSAALPSGQLLRELPGSGLGKTSLQLGSVGFHLAIAAWIVGTSVRSIRKLKQEEEKPGGVAAVLAFAMLRYLLALMLPAGMVAYVWSLARGTTGISQAARLWAQQLE